MAETRLILDSETCPGTHQAAMYSLPRLIELIDELPSEKWPELIRGDCAFGNENVLAPIENRGLEYLFKMKLTKKAKNLIIDRSNKDWADAGQGWEGIASTLQRFLHAWGNMLHGCK